MKNSIDLLSYLDLTVPGGGSHLHIHCRFHIKWPLFSAQILQNDPVFGEKVAKKRPFNMKYAATTIGGRFQRKFNRSFSVNSSLIQGDAQLVLKFCVKQNNAEKEGSIVFLFSLTPSAVL